MAKSKVNRSQLVRDYKKKYPALKPQALSELIKKEAGEAVAPNYISMIISNEKKKKGTGGTGKPGRPKGSKNRAAKAAAPRTGSTGSMNMENLLLAKKFVAEMGGVEKAKAAMQAYSQLVD